MLGAFINLGFAVAKFSILFVQGPASLFILRSLDFGAALKPIQRLLALGDGALAPD